MRYAQPGFVPDLDPESIEELIARDADLARCAHHGRRQQLTANRNRQRAYKAVHVANAAQQQVLDEAEHARLAALRKLRFLVFRRDNGRCWLCGGDTVRVQAPHIDGLAAVASEPLAATLDHVTPTSAGGADDPNNLRCAHQHCNRFRGTKSPYEAWLSLCGFTGTTLDAYLNAPARFTR
jgi:hypothetical protein